MAELLLDAYTELVHREHPLSDNEELALGSAVVARICGARELRRRGGRWQICIPEICAF